MSDDPKPLEEALQEAEEKHQERTEQAPIANPETDQPVPRVTPDPASDRPTTWPYKRFLK